MNNEIKKILNLWKKHLSWCYENNDKTIETHRENIKKIIDYITNLQEENEIRQIDINNLTYQLAKEKEDKKKAIEKLESIRIFGLRSGKTLFSTLINETIDILKGE